MYHARGNVGSPAACRVILGLPAVYRRIPTLSTSPIPRKVAITAEPP